MACPCLFPPRRIASPEMTENPEVLIFSEWHSPQLAAKIDATVGGKSNGAADKDNEKYRQTARQQIGVLLVLSVLFICVICG